MGQFLHVLKLHNTQLELLSDSVKELHLLHRFNRIFELRFDIVFDFGVFVSLLQEDGLDELIVEACLYCGGCNLLVGFGLNCLILGDGPLESVDSLLQLFILLGVFFVGGLELFNLLDQFRVSDREVTDGLV